MSQLLFEIGFEEMPARFVAPAINQFAELATQELQTAGLPFDELTTEGTPRRLVLMVGGLAEGQADSEDLALGPPVKAAFDAEGQPTKAALGFAKSQGIEVSDLETIDTDKGPRVGVRKQVTGRPTAEVLVDLLPRLTGRLSFSKTMRWGSETFRFARPIHWFVALLDGQVVPFELAGIASNNTSRGHRFMSPAAFEVTGIDDYLAKLAAANVMVQRDARKAEVVKEVQAAAAQSGGSLVPDDELLEEVADLVELPVACLGSFDQEFLEVPRAVIISAMREHQRYFALEDAAGKLLPNFIAVNNTRPRDLSVVAQGHQRVLRARLADARFFLLEDAKTPLIDLLGELEGVTFHAKLGTSRAKVDRAAKLAVHLASALGADAAKVERAALLAKCDLVTEMVGEFPSLQGVVGAEYARRNGEDPEVAEAIAEHYLPAGSGGDLPAGLIGTTVGLADRLDSICGFLGVGLTPTGAADPYALRRAAIAVIRVITEKELTLSLDDLLDAALAGLEGVIDRPADQVKPEVIEFLARRMAGLLAEQGVPTDVAEAVLAAGLDDLSDTRSRALALAQVKDSPDFAPLAAGMKRVMNILRKEADQVPNQPPAENLLEAGAERGLYDAFQGLAEEAEARMAQGDYLGFLKGMSGLKGPIDQFFDDVMVMVEDEGLRRNRLALLNLVAGLFSRVAQFTHLQLA